MTLQALLGVSDVVLMDLRAFSEKNAGCRFELEQLIERFDTRKVVLVIDATTNAEYLRSLLSEAWAVAGRERGARAEQRLSIVRIERQSSREIERLFATLVAAAEPASGATRGPSAPAARAEASPAAPSAVA